MDSDFLRLARRVKAIEAAQTATAAGGTADGTAGETTAMTRMTGEMLLWPGAAAPEGWLLCDGAEVSRTEQAALFAVIGTAYGSGDGSATFNLPNLKGRVAAGRDSGDASFETMGLSGGEKAHTLTADEMPGHTHAQNSHTHGSGTLSAAAGGGHRHSLYWPSNDRYVSLSSANGGGDYHASGYATGYSSSAVYDQSLIAKDVDGHTHSMTGAISAATPTNQNAGGGGGHNNLPPYVVLNYIIKT
ncbi:MAG: tail fiber protein [Bacillota bacterium]